MGDLLLFRESIGDGGMVSATPMRLAAAFSRRMESLCTEC
jgi:hypothetical protein